MLAINDATQVGQPSNELSKTLAHITAFNGQPEVRGAEEDESC
jgi:hypothetical protein